MFQLWWIFSCVYLQVCAFMRTQEVAYISKTTLAFFPSKFSLESLRRIQSSKEPQTYLVFLLTVCIICKVYVPRGQYRGDTVGVTEASTILLLTSKTNTLDDGMNWKGSCWGVFFPLSVVKFLLCKVFPIQIGACLGQFNYWISCLIGAHGNLYTLLGLIHLRKTNENPFLVAHSP